MKARFELERTAVPNPLLQPHYVDPESATPEASDLDPYDPSEQYFSITVDKTIDTSARFIVNEEPADAGEGKKTPDTLKGTKSVAKPGADLQASEKNEFAQVQAVIPHPEHESGWRQEVSDRLSKYQARRRVREPRYPSLRLKFEPSEAWTAPPSGVDSIAPPVANSSSLAKNLDMEILEHHAPPKLAQTPITEAAAARIIEFPRSLSAIPKHAEELAEPVFDRPRIMEAPDLVPALQALEGILIERAEILANEKRAGFEMPLQAAQMGRRLAATAIDLLIVVAALALFASIFWKVTASVPSIRIALPTLAAAAAILWAGYQYLLLVQCGTTPGLRIAKLKLSHFDGSAVPKQTRRWRTVASMLSAISLGLGYAWCFLDEDQLCWHDRITRTYIAPLSM